MGSAPSCGATTADPDHRRSRGAPPELRRRPQQLLGDERGGAARGGGGGSLELDRVRRSSHRRRSPVRPALDGDVHDRHRGGQPDPTSIPSATCARIPVIRATSRTSTCSSSSCSCSYWGPASRSCSWAGRCGALLVPAHRLLVREPGLRERGQEGVHHEPDRRRGLPRRHVPPLHGLRDAGLHPRARGGGGDLRLRRRPRHRHHAPPLPRLHRQVGPDSASHVASRRHGRTDAGLGAHSRGDDGDGGGLSDRAHERALRALARLPGVVAPWARGRRCSRRRSRSGRTTSRRCWRTPRSRSSATCSSPSAWGRSRPASST